MMSRVLLNCSTTRLEDMLEKGNVWYTLHYREYFDQYVCGYLRGRRASPVERDGVHLVPMGTGHTWLDLLMAPIRVNRLARRVEATHLLTADLILAWWHFALVRLLRGMPLVVMPVCNPDEIFKTSGKSFSGLPIAVERLCINLSFRAADTILCVATDPVGVAWVRSSPFSGKLKIVGVLPEEFSAPEFVERLRVGLSMQTGRSAGTCELVYVGRLEREKLVDDLIDAAIRLKAAGRNFRLTLVGDGAERNRLEERVRAAVLESHVVFAGFQPAGAVAGYLLASDIFVSPYTGTSLREAALAGLPIVAYRLGGIEKLFTDGENCVLVEAGDVAALAERVGDLIDSPDSRRALADNVRAMAEGIWSMSALRDSLREAFEPYDRAIPSHH